MSVAKVIKIIAHSPNSFDDAVKRGVEQAAKSVHGISGVEVENFSAKVENNKITEYRATVHVAFSVEGTD